MNALHVIKTNGTHVYYIIKYTKTAFYQKHEKMTICQTSDKH